MSNWLGLAQKMRSNALLAISCEFFATQMLKVSTGCVRFAGLPVFAPVSRWVSLRLSTREELLCSPPGGAEEVRPQKIHRAGSTVLVAAKGGARFFVGGNYLTAKIARERKRKNLGRNGRTASPNAIALPGCGWYSTTVSLNLHIPDDVVSALRLPPAEAEEEMRKELALALYSRGALGFGKARALAGLSVWEFDELLGARGVVRPYGKTDLEMDLSYARGDQ